MKQIMLLAVAVAAVVALWAARPAVALPPNEVEIHYYDASGDEIGWYFRGCNGQRIIDGSQSGATSVKYGETCSSGNFGVTCRVNNTFVSCTHPDLWGNCVALSGGVYCQG